MRAHVIRRLLLVITTLFILSILVFLSVRFIPGDVIGGTSGFLGGKLDLVVQRFVDAWMSFPGLLLLLTIIAIVGQGLLQLIAVLGISGGIVGSRVLRSAVIGVKENDYFQSAVAIGASQWKIIVRHVLPNIAAPIIATLQNWEQGRRRPDGPARALLKVATENPEAIERALRA